MFCMLSRFAETILAVPPCLCSSALGATRDGCCWGAQLAPGLRTVTSILRIIGLQREPHFVNYNRVLNHAVWHSRRAGRLLLDLLISTFVSTGPMLLV